jgi:hypothetical protein
VGFKGPRELWLDKKYGGTFKGNKYTEAGNFLEPRVIQLSEEWFARQCGYDEPLRFVPDVRYERRLTYDGVEVIFRSNLDAVIPGPTCQPKQYDQYMYGECIPERIVEAKTVTERSFEIKWGAPGDIEGLPETYLLQVYTQMWCSGAQHAYLSALCGGVHDYHWYIPRPNEQELEDLMTHCAAWWVTHVVGDVEPDGPPPSLDFLRTIERDTGETIILPDEMYDKALLFEHFKGEANRFRRDAEALKAELISALRNCERAVFESAPGMIRYELQGNRRVFIVEREQL